MRDSIETNDIFISAERVIRLRLIITDLFIEKGNWFTDQINQSMIDQLFQQLNYLHNTLKVVHNDTVTKNILVNTEQNKIAIIDFEKSCWLGDQDCSIDNDYLSLISSFYLYSPRKKRYVLPPSNSIRYKNLASIIEKIKQHLGSSHSGVIKKILLTFDGRKRYLIKNGHRYLIRYGNRGGSYIVINGRKKYLKTSELPVE